jgi:hypothetical protein
VFDVVTVPRSRRCCLHPSPCPRLPPAPTSKEKIVVCRSLGHRFLPAASESSRTQHQRQTPLSRHSFVYPHYLTTVHERPSAFPIIRNPTHTVTAIPVPCSHHVDVSPSNNSHRGGRRSPPAPRLVYPYPSVSPPSRNTPLVALWRSQLPVIPTYRYGLAHHEAEGAYCLRVVCSVSLVDCAVPPLSYGQRGCRGAECDAHRHRDGHGE